MSRQIDFVNAIQPSGIYPKSEKVVLLAYSTKITVFVPKAKDFLDTATDQEMSDAAEAAKALTIDALYRDSIQELLSIREELPKKYQGKINQVIKTMLYQFPAPAKKTKVKK